MLRRSNRIWLAAGTVLVLAGVGFIYSCGSSSNSTNPYGGGGGGGGALELNSGDIVDGTTFPHAFATAGSFGYHCQHHPTIMVGTVTVNSGGTTMDTTITIASIAAFPAVTCKVGGTIHWHNTSGVTHTVTSN
jgi:plastocyanin